MPQEILSKKTKTNLETLRKAGILRDFYLAGGTGLALQLKHRVSLDFDFFIKNWKFLAARFFTKSIE